MGNAKRHAFDNETMGISRKLTNAFFAHQNILLIDQFAKKNYFGVQRRHKTFRGNKISTLRIESNKFRRRISITKADIHTTVKLTLLK